MTPGTINRKVANKLGGKPADYCGSMATAWTIVESVRKKYGFEMHSTPTYYIAHFYGNDGMRVVTAESDTASMAICVAFLKLK